MVVKKKQASTCIMEGYIMQISGAELFVKALLKEEVGIEDRGIAKGIEKGEIYGTIGSLLRARYA